MPTYRNSSRRPVSYFLKLYQNDGNYRHVVVTFAPGESKAINFALPDYGGKGMELVDANFPPLPDPMIIDNTSDYSPGVSREFVIRPCDRYLVQVFVYTGAVRVRFGAKGTPFIINAELAQMFGKKVDWESAPVVIVEGLSRASCTLHIEELQAGEFGGVMDAKIY